MGTTERRKYGKMEIKGDRMKTEWVYCPICGSKIKLKLNEDTEIKNLPSFCPKCKNAFIIDVEKPFKVTTK